MPRPRRRSTSRLLKVIRHRLFLFLPVASFAFFAPAPAQAEQQGLNATGYYINQIPPTQSDELYTVCGTGVYPNINWTWDYPENHFGQCGWDQFMIHYTGYITIPEGVGSVRFAVASDDGGTVTIGDSPTFGNWWDQGCFMTYDERRVFPTGQSLPIDAWFYENGGGTCFMLFWQFNDDSSDWNIVPWEAFTTEPSAPTTTTSTTLEETTTTQSTVVETSTTEPPVESTTTVPPTTQETTTTVQETTTTTSSTIVETTTTVPETTTTWTTTTTTTIAPSTTVIDTTTTVVASTTTESTVVPTTTDSIPPTTQPSKNASDKVKKAFEAQVNVFDGGYDDYVPSGSTITVAQRRAVIAATTVLFVLPIPIPTSSTSGSTSGRQKE